MRGHVGARHSRSFRDQVRIHRVLYGHQVMLTIRREEGWQQTDVAS
ncbi:hypothetical protein KCH_76270 [Kitasatospora cheerisanensis KCTC 2395]|uniref:Uncharacterized protein n=1 Tax=Kitasatospora cheerisanensis KCTC 2395 TaxID=1348663 RepID=A0A066YGF7_9ACTN|nr:hypothetical protein KCH_76270 [Kitasatospora cheerisanensis KCTC 2395]